MKQIAIITAVLVVWAGLAIAESTPVKAERSIDELLQTCILCHGTTGNSKDATAPDVNNPNLGGQHRDYLLISMKQYKSGERDNAVMRSMLTSFTDDELARIARHYSQQDGLWDTAYPKWKYKK